VQDRLRGYFGNAAAITISRDTIRNMTLVTIVLPHNEQTI